MAVNEQDRVSSRRLLDMLKGLQESRHLGSEPEVVTETVEYPAKIRPVAGTYPNTEQGLLDMLSDSAIDIEHNLPVKVYGLIARDANGFTVPEKSGEPLATLDIISNVAGLTFISDVEITSEMIINQPITGHYFMANYNGLGYGCFYEKSDLTNPNTMHVWETTASTETITTKTKHTIKQDYVPNADWNQNDPDGDGYVEGRTHWVESGIADVVVENEGGITHVQSFGKIYGYSWEAGAAGEAGEWYPEFEAVKTNYQGLDFWLLAMDGEGNQITDFETAMSDSANMIACIDSETALGITGYVMATRTPNTVRMMVEVVHKLDRKFYDYTEPYEYDDTNCVKKNDISIQTISRNYESTQGPFTHSYNFVKLPNGRAYGNITLHVDSWDDTTKTGTFSTVGTPLANPGSMVGGTAYVNGGIVFFTVEADGSNPRISNPIPSDLLVVNRAGMLIPQMFIRKEDE